MMPNLSDQAFWEDAWVRHIEQYLAVQPRCGYWLASAFPSRSLSIMEIAGGSCRDSRYLAERGCQAIGSDFEQRTLDYIATRFPNSPLVLQREDAFALSLRDKAIDLTFHNGFWVLFNDDHLIHKLIHEQARVTRRYMVALVHNGENQRQVDTFGMKASEDPIYDIRFFRRQELCDVISASGLTYRQLTLRKFGGPAEGWMRSKIRGVPNPFRHLSRLMIARLYDRQSWQDTERIACVIELA